ncbi:elongation factor 1-beta [Myxozyma melibiosi]|uniref:Elongation factor 1-beta n=1 Tax=Myxozyma melibiosi TaxID=54550 RepID=A0ABR1F2R0_9ASCO
MGFGDLSAASGLAKLNSFLVSESYISGFAPSQADVIVFKAVGAAPDKATYPAAARWYKNIASYESEFSSLPGDASADVASLGPEDVAEAAPAAAEEEDDDDVDLFGSDDEEEDAEAEKVKAERLAEYQAKKAAKGPKPAAKSIVTLDVKPWDDTTDINEMLENLKGIEKDGLVWGAHQFIPVGYGIKKIQINLVVEDEKVSLDDLQAEIEEDEDHVQSTDIIAMQKL